MELMPGRNLKETWDELSEIKKVSICSQLREAFTHIRSIPSPGFFGDVIGGPLHTHCSFTGESGIHESMDLSRRQRNST